MNRFQEALKLAEECVTIRDNGKWCEKNADVILEALKMASQQEQTIEAVKKQSIPRLGIFKKKDHIFGYNYDVAPTDKTG